MYNNLVKSIFSGIMIATADFIYMNAENKVIASFIFPLALISIIMSQSYLYTGKIGYTTFDKNGLKFMSTVLLGNIIGLLVLILFYRPEYSVFITNKLNQNYWLLFGEAFFCGILMYTAVTYTDGGKNFLVTVLCVAGFILGKCEHSIADIGYIIASHEFTLQSLLFVVIVLLGNSIGSIFLNKIVQLEKLNK